MNAFIYEPLRLLAFLMIGATAISVLTVAGERDAAAARPMSAIQLAQR